MIASFQRLRSVVVIFLTLSCLAHSWLISFPSRLIFLSSVGRASSALTTLEGRLAVLGPAIGEEVAIVEALHPPPVLSPGLNFLVGKISLVFRPHFFLDG